MTQKEFNDAVNDANQRAFQGIVDLLMLPLAAALQDGKKLPTPTRARKASRKLKALSDAALLYSQTVTNTSTKR